MRILVINFEMDPNSAVLAWQYRVAVSLAEYVERVVVLTQKRSFCQLPENVEVYEIPRWYCKAPYRWGGAKWLVNFLLYKLIRQYAFNACFIHMDMEWAYRLYPCFRLFRIPVVLWYAHGSVSFRLRLAHLCVDRVISSSKHGFRLPSTKLRIIGQGIDTDLFRPSGNVNPSIEVLHVGRISRRKRIDIMIQAIAELKKLPLSDPIRLRLIGKPLTRDDLRYEHELEQLIASLDVEERVLRAGHVPMEELPQAYQNAFVHLNLSTTGSMDKTVLEALACGCPVLTSNVAYIELFRRKGLDAFLLKDITPRAIANRLLSIYRDQNHFDRAKLRSIVTEEHDLKGYIKRIVENLREVA